MNIGSIIGYILVLSWFILLTYATFAKELSSRGTIMAVAWACFIIGGLCIFFNMNKI